VEDGEAVKRTPGKRAGAVKLVRLLLGVLLAVLVAGASMVIVSASGATDPKASSGWLSGGVRMQAAMLVVSLILILALSRGKIARYGFVMPAWLQLKSAFVSGSIVAILTHAVAAVVWTLAPPSTGHPGLTGSSLLQTVVTVWIIASICEEVFYRGLVQTFLRPLGGHGLTIAGVRLSLPVIAAAMLFGLMHLMLLAVGASGFLVSVIVGTAVVVGLVAGYFREMSDSLVPAILVHFLFNAYGGASAHIQKLAGG
jgi:membrane protease YdiL (CAAX protease family)